MGTVNAGEVEDLRVTLIIGIEKSLATWSETQLMRSCLGD